MKSPETLVRRGLVSVRHCLILRVSKENLESGKSGISKKPFETWGCSSAGRAPALQAGGQEFDSPHLHHKGLRIWEKEGR